MGSSTHRTRAFAATATAAVFAVTAAMTTATPAEAATVKTVKVRVTATKITFSGGGATTANGVTTLRSGRYHFHVVTPSGSRSLQLMRFKNGYTLAQAEQDFALFGEDHIDAVQRVDNNVDFRGGIGATAKHSGDMYVTLHAAEFTAADLDGDARAKLNVVGKAPKQPSVHRSGTYTAFTYGWDVTRHLPAAGTVKFTNQADQPHVLDLIRVKSSTTAAKVRRFIKAGPQANPTFVLGPEATSGFVSPKNSQLLDYDLPPGKYLVLCFYPDYFTGMEHYRMGMWKLVTLS